MIQNIVIQDAYVRQVVAVSIEKTNGNYESSKD